jgi:hypothetical protein
LSDFRPTAAAAKRNNVSHVGPTHFWSQGFLNPQDLRPKLSQKSTHQIFLMKPWFHKCKKVTVSLFHRKFKIGPFLAKNGPKLAIFGQNSSKSVFFALIFKSTHQIFLIFPMNPRFHKCKKMSVSLFCRKFKIGPFLAKNG